MLVEFLERLYRDQAKVEVTKPRRWNRASSIGRCPRELGYTKLHADILKSHRDDFDKSWDSAPFQGEPLTPRRMSIFDDGNFYDQKIKDDLIKAMGGGIVALPYGSWPSVMIEGVEISGTPDFLIMPGKYPTIGLGEIKSMSNFAFERAVAGNIDESYCCQAWVYAAQNALNPIVFICVRKETRHICEVIFDKTASETVITKRYGGNELEIAANDPMLIAEVRSPFGETIEKRVKQTIRDVRDCQSMESLPIGVRIVEPEALNFHGKEKAEAWAKENGKVIGDAVKSGSWYGFDTGRKILGWPCDYCGFKKNCFPEAELELNGGKPKWVLPEN